MRDVSRAAWPHMIPDPPGGWEPAAPFATGAVQDHERTRPQPPVVPIPERTLPPQYLHQHFAPAASRRAARRLLAPRRRPGGLTPMDETPWKLARRRSSSCCARWRGPARPSPSASACRSPSSRSPRSRRWPRRKAGDASRSAAGPGRDECRFVRSRSKSTADRPSPPPSRSPPPTRAHQLPMQPTRCHRPRNPDRPLVRLLAPRNLPATGGPARCTQVAIGRVCRARADLSPARCAA